MRRAGIPLRRVFRFGAVLAVGILAGCAGMEPYEPYDEREEGPRQGLYSGPDGEFVIFRSGRRPTPDEEREEKKREKGS